MGAQEDRVYFEIKNAVSLLSPPLRDQVEATAARISQLVTENEEAGKMALALVGAFFSRED